MSGSSFQVDFTISGVMQRHSINILLSKALDAPSPRQHLSHPWINIMAPTAVHELVDIPHAKGQQSKIVNGHVELETVAPAPVADNFMYDFKYNHPLPTIDALGADIPHDSDPNQIAESLAADLSTAWSSETGDQFAGMFLDYG